MTQAKSQKHNGEVWDLLHDFLRRFMPVSDSEFQAWKPYFELRTFDKKQVVTALGEQEEYVNIVARGMARKYVKLNNGEVTMQIAPEGHMIHAECSFHHREPAALVVETIEPTIFISIHYDNLQRLYDAFPRTEQLGRLFVTEMFIIKDRRYFELLKKSTREIFLDYMSAHPHMLQRVPQKYLASYLNIKPETFSRLKHLLRRKKVS
ncbi:MAG TPA: Crp/Fnr family transcriptional regulator [Chitinophagaceae bacterium]|nr:Crp/Fnr family transcriptional regulator [Chitinophagaceae bacterium]